MSPDLVRRVSSLQVDKSISLSHDPDSEEAERAHALAEELARKHGIKIIEVPDAKGGLCTEFPNSYGSDFDETLHWN